MLHLPMLWIGDMLATSVSMAMYFLSSASKASRLGLVFMKASYVACTREARIHQAPFIFRGDNSS